MGPSFTVKACTRVSRFRVYISVPLSLFVKKAEHTYIQPGRCIWAGHHLTTLGPESARSSGAGVWRRGLSRGPRRRGGLSGTGAGGLWRRRGRALAAAAARRRRLAVAYEICYRVLADLLWTREISIQTRPAKSPFSLALDRRASLFAADTLDRHGLNHCT